MNLKLQIKDGKIFAPLKQKWLVLKPEEEVRQKYIVRLVNNYGYCLSQMEQEIVVNNTKRGTGGARADIIVYKTEKDKNHRKNALIVVECKADNLKIQKEDYYQGANYASMTQADFVVTTNFKETKIFKLVKGEIPNLLDEIIDIPKADIVNDTKKIEALLRQTKAFTRDEFSKLLFTCHNIIRNNDKLTPEEAFEEISKILFIKIGYERENTGVQIFSQEEFKKDRENYEKYNSDFYQYLFKQTKDEFKYIFDRDETIKIRENSFEAIVKELEIYNLSTTSDDVKGIAFEKFLGKTFRGDLGQYFTPRTVVDFMVEILDPQEGEIICDPCCGSGGFLIKAFEYVRAKIENEIHEQKQKLKQKYSFDKRTQKEEIDKKVNEIFNKLNQDLDITNEKSRLYMLSFDCIFGMDANRKISQIAKMNMIMNGGRHEGIYHHDGLLNVNGIYENRFDIILTNPPFGVKVYKTTLISEADTNQTEIYRKQFDDANVLKQLKENIGKKLLSLYKTASNIIYVLFLERCLNLLKPGGRMGIVLPEGILNNTNLQNIRDFVESRAKIVLITSLPRDVFVSSGANVKTSLLFFKKFTEEETKQWKEIAEKAEKQINKKYNDHIQQINEKLALRGKKAPSIDKGEKKELRKQLKVLQEKIKIEIKAKIKQEFDYQIPIAEVEKAGISRTGAKIKNELIPLCKEFIEYRKQNQLWENKFTKISYEVRKDGKVFRIPTVGKPQEI